MKKFKLLSLVGIASVALAHAGLAAGHGGGGGGFGGGGFHGGGFGGGGFRGGGFGGGGFHGGGFRGGGHFSPMRGGHAFARGGPGTLGGRNWRGNWGDHHHRFSNDRFFFGDFGFPGWDWGYPYGYYGYDYYPYDYYGYGGYGYDNGSSIAQMQRQLAQAGYYQGAIDGIMGPATRSAIRAYERDK